MRDEEVGVCGGEDDDFGIVGGVDVGGEGVDEGGYVGGEFVVPEVDRWVVDDGVDYATVCGCGEGAVAWGGSSGVNFGRKAMRCWSRLSIGEEKGEQCKLDD